MINSVRSAVLSILNKNNYGYVPVSDFNLFCKLAQLDLFESYFYQYNYQLNKENARQSGTGYADIKKLYEEAIDTFLVTNTLTRVIDNVFSLPSLTTTGDQFYKIEAIICYDATGNFTGIAEYVAPSKIDMLMASNLTAPTTTFPAYTVNNGNVEVYPSTINTDGRVKARYIRYPKDPKWTYIQLANGEPVFNQSASDYQDFEVPIEDEVTLVNKILEYAGMSIREIQAVQFGQAKEQINEQQEK